MLKAIVAFVFGTNAYLGSYSLPGCPTIDILEF